MSEEVLRGLARGLLISGSIWATIGIGVLLLQLFDAVTERWGRVPVLDPMWWKMRDAVEWALRLPGRAVRWLRPRDTPRGLGGP